MASQVRGVVATAVGEPVQVVTIVVPDPGPGEAVVRVQACGVCHTDLHYREGGISDDFPFLLGHEAAGIVEAVGPDVTSVAPGDFVVLNWRAVCGDCRSCRRGRPQYCFATHNATQKMTLADGTPVENHEVAGGDGGHVGPDGLHDAGGLVAEQEGELVVDAALPVVEVGVAHPAGLDPHHGLARPRVGHPDGHHRYRSALGEGHHSAYVARHVALLSCPVVLSIGPQCGTATRPAPGPLGP